MGMDGEQGPRSLVLSENLPSVAVYTLATRTKMPLSFVSCPCPVFHCSQSGHPHYDHLRLSGGNPIWALAREIYVWAFGISVAIPQRGEPHK